MLKNAIKKKEMIIQEKIKLVVNIIFILSFVSGLIYLINAAGFPQGPDDVSVIANYTKGNVSAYKIDTKGGIISLINMSSTAQNPRWKAFVGWVYGVFTLDDANGKTIYDWRMSSTSGNVFATRNGSSVNWWNIKCATIANLTAEDIALSHSGINDNITATFKDNTHDAFVVASTLISANSCPTLNTYVNDSAQDDYFEEMALSDGYNIIYATILEEDKYGFNENTYDFQMIVPENGSALWTGSIPYYLYVELGV